jgi:hypothetical protein
MTETLAKVAETPDIRGFSKAPNTFPLVDRGKIEHLQDNIQALRIKLTENQVKYAQSVRSVDMGFPGNFVGVDPKVSERLSAPFARLTSFSFFRASNAIGYEA